MDAKKSNLVYRVVAILIVVIVIAAVFVIKNQPTNKLAVNTPSTTQSNYQQPVKEIAVKESPKTSNENRTIKAKFLDLGSVNCIPCKAMVPVLEALKTEYPNELQADFINVNINQQDAEYYKVQVIPTLIFFDKNDKELYRNVGAMSKEEVVKKFEELGIKLTK